MRSPAPTVSRCERALRALTLLAVAIAVVTVAATRAGGQDGGPHRGQADLGRQIFAQDCAQCHGEAARGTDDGPPLVGVGAASVDFMLRTGRMPLPAPDARMERRPPRYDAQERAAVVAYVTSLGGDGPPIPEVDPDAGDIAMGRAVFASACAACHGPTAAGGAVGGRAIAPGLGLADPVEMAEAVRTGPGVMPRFGREQLSDDELDSLIRYVLLLRDRDIAPAGVRFGRSGPVTEGLLAWAIGLVLLLLAAYLLGTKRGGEDVGGR